MEVQVAMAKVNRFASTESGDTFEAIDRPNGGLSVVLADGQSLDQGAKAVSMLVVHKVIGLLADGVLDGAAARAASDALYTEKQGKVTCNLNIGRYISAAALLCLHAIIHSRSSYLARAGPISWLKTAYH